MPKNVLNTLHRYRTIVAGLAILLVGALTFATIWFIYRAQQPLAPTAPVSIPKAGDNLCSTQFTVPNECLSLTPSGELEPGNSVSLECVGLEGTDRYIFEYRTSSSSAFLTLDASEVANISAEVELGEYFDARCTPCAGDLCASEQNVAENCSLNMTTQVLTSPTPSPSPSVTPSPSPSVKPSPTPSVTPSPSPSVKPSPTPTPPAAPQCNSECVTNSDCPVDLVCSEGNCRNSECLDDADCVCAEKITAGFFIEKFNDQNGDGTRNNDEPGLDWEFEWDRNGDENWRKYTTYANKSGKGGTVGDLTPGDKIRVREKGKSGWVATTVTERTLTIQAGKTVSGSFGNWQPVASSKPSTQPVSSPVPVASPTAPPDLPVSGSTAQTVGLLSIGVLAIGLGLYRFMIKR